MNRFLNKKEEIEAWLYKHQIQNYVVIPHEKYWFVVNVQGDINFDNKGFDSTHYFIPVKFYEIFGNFSCSSNYLKSLDFGPEIVHGDFDCSNNQLVSLEFGPQIVARHFCFSENQITSFEHCPEKIGGSLICSHNQLKSLEYCPKIIKGNFNCGKNQINSLKFCPNTIYGTFSFWNNQVSSLEFFPDLVKGEVHCTSNPLPTSQQKINNFKQLHNIHKEICVEQEKSQLLASISSTTKNQIKNIFKI